MTTMMGLFAEIHHAWVSIDNALYLWDYTSPDPDLIGFEEQPVNITAVKLVKPRPGVFVAAITHLLVVSTQNDLLLIGLSAEKSATGIYSVKLYSTGMHASVKGVNVHSIVGSDKSGRIFFGGKASNDVYELLYQQEDNWFVGRCSKVNRTRPGVASVVPAVVWPTGEKAESVFQMEIDDSRNLVYTLSNKGAIRAFHMSDANTLKLAVSRSLDATKQQMTHMVTTGLSPIIPANGSIISISPISAREATRISLVAVTSTGARIFFSATTSNYYSADATSAPSSIQVHHVKFSPSSNPSASGAPAQMKVFLSARYAPGFSFFLSKPENMPDSIIITAPESGRVATANRSSDAMISASTGSRFVETSMALQLGSVAEDLGLVTPPFAASSGPTGFGNELATQFDGDSGAAEVAVLTSTGVFTFRRRRMVDQFASLIRANKISDENLESAVTDFMRRNGRAEAIAMALAVCCGQAVDVSGDGTRLATVTEPDVIESARKIFVTMGGKATFIDNGMPASSVSLDSVKPSPRHEGMALYVTRILRSIWKATIVKEVAMPNGALSTSSRFPLQQLRDVQRDLGTLKDFLDQNRAFIDGLAGPEALGRAANRQDELAMQGENRALTGLLKLVVDVIEGVAFVLVLFEDNRADAIFAKLDEKNRHNVRSLTYEGLFVSDAGKDLAKALVKAIVNSNIEAGSNVETVAEALRRKCGSFCSPEDVMVFKAQEMLNRAAKVGKDSDVGRSQLNDSYYLFKNIAASLRMEVLRQAVANYVALEYWAGAISLVLEVAQASDPANRASGWVKDGKPADDPRQALFERRKECYNIVHDIVTAVDASRASQRTSGSRDQRMREAYGVIDDSNDELFLSNLYDWYLSKGWSDRLLELTSAYVVSYLQRKSLEDVDHANLLWRYYSHHSQYFEAARVQLQLAVSNFELGLSMRIEYLSRAKANASTRAPGMGSVRSKGSVRGLNGVSNQGRQDVLREIGTQLDLANVQQDLLSRLQADPRLPADRAVEIEQDLNGKIQSLEDVRRLLSSSPVNHAN
jgi:nuclear pore complex protein Nup155